MTVSDPLNPSQVACDADVVIVGYGPVGQAWTGLLGRAGHRVVGFERFRGIYRLPRAVHLDHEIMRLLQALGLAERLAKRWSRCPTMNGSGLIASCFCASWPQTAGCSAWASDYMFFQPNLEAALDRVARAQPGVTVERGWVAEGLSDSASGVEVMVRLVAEEEVGRVALTRETRTVRARWLVVADGANSFVREASGITRRELGFEERWLVVDAEPNDMSALADLPVAGQWCDPARPRTHIQSGRVAGAGSSCSSRTRSPQTSRTRSGCRGGLPARPPARTSDPRLASFRRWTITTRRERPW